MDTATHNSHLSCSPADLYTLMGRADAPLILDVRREAKFALSARIIAGAVRCAPEDIETFARTYAHAHAHARAPQTRRDVVVYCVYGHNVSEDAAKTLRAAGWNARALAGGIEGGEDGVDTADNIALWRSQGLPTIAKRTDLGVTGEAASRWITRSRPKIDRIACPWLIQRFIDPRAEFFYVPTAEVFTQAELLNAVAYDIAGGAITHAGAHGELCSFDALLLAFNLRIPALDLLARIVRGADTDQLDLAPQCAGLLATSLGMSALITDDHAMLAAMLTVYDALYAWCVQSAAGQAEQHHWTTSTTGKAA